MNKPEISVIVPVYNARGYLSKCVNSILSQGVESMEILLIDDGSTDGSGDLCDELARSDKRIKVIHKSNGGVNTARNMGLNHMSGDYVMFMDADDFLEPDTLQCNMQLLDVDKSIDIVQFPMKQMSGETFVNIRGCDYPMQHTIYEGSLDLILNWYNSRSPILGELPSKIYRSYIFKEYHLREDMHFMEDVYTIPDFAVRANKVMVSTLGGYIYAIREGSAVNSTFTVAKMTDRCRTYIHIYQSLCILAKNRFERVDYFFDTFQECLNLSVMCVKTDELDSFISFLSANKVGLRYFGRLSKKKKVWSLICLCLPLRMICSLYSLIVHWRVSLQKKM